MRILIYTKSLLQFVLSIPLPQQIREIQLIFLMLTLDLLISPYRAGQLVHSIAVVYSEKSRTVIIPFSAVLDMFLAELFWGAF